MVCRDSTEWEEVGFVWGWSDNAKISGDSVFIVREGLMCAVLDGEEEVVAEERLVMVCIGDEVHFSASLVSKKQHVKCCAKSDGKSGRVWEVSDVSYLILKRTVVVAVLWFVVVVGMRHKPLDNSPLNSVCHNLVFVNGVSLLRNNLPPKFPEVLPTGLPLHVPLRKTIPRDLHILLPFNKPPANHRRPGLLY